VTQLEGCIQFWQSKLDYERYLMGVSTQTIIESTIKYLEKLESNDKQKWPQHMANSS